MADQIEVNLWNFARYVVSDYEGRIRLINKLLDQKESGYHRKRDMYRAIREGTRIAFNTDPATALDEIQKIPLGVNNAVWRKHTALNAEALAQGWKDQQASFFWPPPTDWCGDDVRVTVVPDLGMRTPRGEYIVRNWYNGREPSQELTDVCLAVMELARPRTWPSSWTPAIWDVRRDDLRTPRQPPNFSLGLAAERGGFGGMWKSIQAQRPI